MPLHNACKKGSNNRHTHVLYAPKEEAGETENLNLPQGFTKDSPNAISECHLQ